MSEWEEDEMLTLEAMRAGEGNVSGYRAGLLRAAEMAEEEAITEESVRDNPLGAGALERFAARLRQEAGDG